MSVSDNQAPLNSGEDHEQLREDVDRRFRRIRRGVLIALVAAVPTIVLITALNAGGDDEARAEQFRSMTTAALPDIGQATDDEIHEVASLTCADIETYGLTGAVNELYTGTSATYMQALSMVNASYYAYCPSAA